MVQISYQNSSVGQTASKLRAICDKKNAHDMAVKSSEELQNPIIAFGVGMGGGKVDWLPSLWGSILNAFEPVLVHSM